MKKYRIIIAITAGCLALCAAVWPHTETVEETLASLQVSAVSNPEPITEDIASEAETPPPTEEKKAKLPQVELLHEVTLEPEPVPEEIATKPKAEPTPEPESKQEQEPAPTSSPAPSQVVTNPQPGDMVYVPGFGWLECQGPSEVIHDENIYENGNKIGVMG